MTIPGNGHSGAHGVNMTGEDDRHLIGRFILSAYREKWNNSILIGGGGIEEKLRLIRFKSSFAVDMSSRTVRSAQIRITRCERQRSGNTKAVRF
jgi:hypothetical protein